MYYLFNGKRFEARKCARCHFIFIAPRPTPEELRLMYSDEYFLFDGSDFGAHASTDYETAAIRGSVKFPAILGAIQKFKPSGKFFEIGCGMGYFLNYANTHGYEASGIEFAALGTEACRTKFGLDVTQSSFEDWRSAPNTYDVIFMGDVLEHFVDPVPMLEKANGMLKPGGVIAAEVPAVFNSLIGRAAAIALKAMNKPRKMQMPPYHVNEFTPATLRNMLEQSGYTNVKIIQRVKAPSTITLRGNAFDRAIKKSLQYPNYFLTTTFGVFGDRMLGIGIK
jgi:2-polyprenyl-3-methyl-5-hydroxy-6-metoxy-1,4-benzoquinol methylase